jgi:flagellar motility protein MotE (MotC chaperone)
MIESENEHPTKKTTSWTKIGAGVAGGLLLALQGVNLSEVIGTADLVKRTEEAIERQGELIKEINKESHRIETGLENQRLIMQNQTVLIDRVNKTIDNQTEMLKSLKNGQDRHLEWHQGE